MRSSYLLEYNHETYRSLAPTEQKKILQKKFNEININIALEPEKSHAKEQSYIGQILEYYLLGSLDPSEQQIFSQKFYDSTPNVPLTWDDAIEFISVEFLVKPHKNKEFQKVITKCNFLIDNFSHCLVEEQYFSDKATLKLNNWVIDINNIKTVTMRSMQESTSSIHPDELTQSDVNSNKIATKSIAPLSNSEEEIVDLDMLDGLETANKSRAQVFMDIATSPLSEIKKTDVEADINQPISSTLHQEIDDHIEQFGSKIHEPKAKKDELIESAEKLEKHTNQNLPKEFNQQIMRPNKMFSQNICEYSHEAYRSLTKEEQEKFLQKKFAEINTEIKNNPEEEQNLIGKILELYFLGALEPSEHQSLLMRFYYNTSNVPLTWDKALDFIGTKFLMPLYENKDVQKLTDKCLIIKANIVYANIKEQSFSEEAKTKILTFMARMFHLCDQLRKEIDTLFFQLDKLAKLPVENINKVATKSIAPMSDQENTITKQKPIVDLNLLHNLENTDMSLEEIRGFMEKAYVFMRSKNYSTALENNPDLFDSTLNVALVLFSSVVMRLFCSENKNVIPEKYKDDVLSRHRENKMIDTNNTKSLNLKADQVISIAHDNFMKVFANPFYLDETAVVIYIVEEMKKAFKEVLDNNLDNAILKKLVELITHTLNKFLARYQEIHDCFKNATFDGSFKNEELLDAARKSEECIKLTIPEEFKAIRTVFYLNAALIYMKVIHQCRKDKGKISEYKKGNRLLPKSDRVISRTTPIASRFVICSRNKCL